MSQIIKIILINITLIISFSITLYSNAHFLKLGKINELLKIRNIIQYNDEFYIHDSFKKCLFKYNINSKELVKIDILKKISEYSFERPIKSIYLHSLRMVDNVPYCLYKVYLDNSDSIQYVSLLINLKNDRIQLLSDNIMYSIYGIDFSKICNNIYIFQTYTNNYHHSEHYKLKDSVAFISTFKNDKLSKLFSIGDLEKYTSSILTYIFELKIITFKNNLILIMKDLDLFVKIEWDCYNDTFKNVEKIERTDLLNNYFKNNIKKNPLRIYEKYYYVNNLDLDLLDVFNNENRFEVILFEKINYIYNFQHFVYNENLKLIGEENFKYSSNIKNPIQILKLNNNLSKNLVILINQVNEFEIIQLKN